MSNDVKKLMISSYTTNPAKEEKPPKYISHEGYVYKRVPMKELKEAKEKYGELTELMQVMGEITYER